MNLHTLQQNFRDVLLCQDDEIGSYFDSAALPGLKIYRTAYRGRLMQTMRNTFEKVRSWVGDEAFEAAARHYIILNPPHSWTLDIYGAGFAQTLAELFPDDPEVPELAWLEWAMLQAFRCPDELLMKPADLMSDALAELDWDAVQLEFVSSFQMRALSTNCPDIWQAFTDAQEPPEASPLSAPLGLCVWRQGLTPHYRVLDPVEHHVLAAMASEASFGDICTILSETLTADTAVSMAGSFVGNWISTEMIASIRR
jgi:hypothetical protein